MSKSKLTAAICQAILDSSHVERDTPRDDGSGKFSSCDAVYRAARVALAGNGITVTAHRLAFDQFGCIRRLFLVRHKSGERLLVPAPPVGYNPHDRMERGAALKSQVRTVICELLLLPQEPEARNCAGPCSKSGRAKPRTADEINAYLDEVVGPMPQGVLEEAVDALEAQWAGSVEPTEYDEPLDAKYGRDEIEAAQWDELRARVEAAGQVKFQRNPVSGDLIETERELTPSRPGGEKLASEGGPASCSENGAPTQRVEGQSSEEERTGDTVVSAGSSPAAPTSTPCGAPGEVSLPSPGAGTEICGHKMRGGGTCGKPTDHEGRHRKAKDPEPEAAPVVCGVPVPGGAGDTDEDWA